MDNCLKNTVLTVIGKIILIIFLIIGQYHNSYAHEQLSESKLSAETDISVNGDLVFGTRFLTVQKLFDCNFENHKAIMPVANSEFEDDEEDDDDDEYISLAIIEENEEGDNEYLILNLFDNIFPTQHFSQYYFYKNVVIQRLTDIFWLGKNKYI